MADQHKYKLLPEDKCLTESQLFDYIDGKLKASEMHFIEKHVLSCGFCSDALEGWGKVKDRQKVATYIPVNNKDEKEESKIITLNPNRKYYAIAAGAVLILGITLFLKLSNSDDLSESKMAAINKSDSISMILQPEKDVQDKSAMAFNSDSLRQETDKRTVFESKKAEKTTSADQGYVVQPADEAVASVMESPRPVAPEETFKADKYSDGDADDFANVVDAKETEKPSKAEGRNEKQKQPNKLKLEEKNNSSRAENNQADKKVIAKDQQVVTEDVPVTTTNLPATQTMTPSNITLSAPSSTGSVISGNTAPSGGYSMNSTDSITVVTKSPSDHELDLSYENANKMLAAGQATASLTLYDEVLKNPTHPHYQDAQWKKAEALIQLKRIDEAKKILNEIAAKPGKYMEQAKEKLKTL
ncbi:MAG: tetratricopeptide repeat protein [Bacteroidia bacterium]